MDPAQEDKLSLGCFFGNLQEDELWLGPTSFPEPGLSFQPFLGNGGKRGWIRDTSALPTAGKTNPERLPGSEGEAHPVLDGKRSLLFSTEPTPRVWIRLLWIRDLRAQIPQCGAGGSAGGWDDEGGVESVTSRGFVAGLNPWERFLSWERSKTGFRLESGFNPFVFPGKGQRQSSIPSFSRERFLTWGKVPRVPNFPQNHQGWI